MQFDKGVADIPELDLTLSEEIIEVIQAIFRGRDSSQEASQLEQNVTVTLERRKAKKALR